jgi:hypothetical protein
LYTVGWCIAKLDHHYLPIAGNLWPDAGGELYTQLRNINQ